MKREGVEVYGRGDSEQRLVREMEGLGSFRWSEIVTMRTENPEWVRRVGGLEVRDGVDSCF